VSTSEADAHVPGRHASLLAFAGDGLEHRLIDAIADLAEQFELTQEQRDELLPGGSQRRFNNRVYWAAAHLRAAGLLESPARGRIRITDRGRQALVEEPVALGMKYLAQFPEWVAFKAGASDQGAAAAQSDPASATPPTLDPLEQMQAAYREMEGLWAVQILEALKHTKPERFERIVIDVLYRLGYAGSRGQALHLGGAHDQGVDGLVTQDHFGFERIYVQAKRFDSQPVTPHDVRDFIGALDLKGATKGVFMTTSTFTKDATELPGRLTAKQIRLIDGTALARLMIEHGIGMQETGDVFTIRAVEPGYFEDQ
jgi:restriction system protein